MQQGRKAIVVVCPHSGMSLAIHLRVETSKILMVPEADVLEVNHEEEFIAQNHCPHSGSRATREHCVVERHNNGGPASLSPARD